jgi:hypothetical protein
VYSTYNDWLNSNISLFLSAWDSARRKWRCYGNKTIITRTYKRELIYPTFDAQETTCDAHGTEGWKAVLENIGFLPRC